MTNTRSTLDSLNARRTRRPASSKASPMEELNRTLEGLEKRLLELEEEAPAYFEANPLPYRFNQPPQDSHENASGIADIAQHLQNLRSVFYQEPEPDTQNDDYSSEIDQELNRISDSVRQLTEQDDNGNTQQLRSELEELKRTVQTLAREESLRRLSHRWDHFDEKFEAFEQRLASEPAIQPQDLHQLDERLDEISRAILSSSMARSSGIEESRGLERMETHLAELTGQIQNSASSQMSDTLLSSIAELSQRVDLLGENSALPARLIERLAEQMTLLLTHVDRAMKHGTPAEFSSLTERLDSIALKLENTEQRWARPDSNLLDTINQRFEDLTQQLDQHHANSTHDMRLMQSLEGRLEDISQQLSVNAAHTSTQNQVGHFGVADSDLMLNLETQVAAIARHLATPQDHTPVLNAINPRLEQIEHALLSNREAVLDAAREATESAIAQIAQHGSAPDTALVQALSDDLKSLAKLARHSDERNGKGFEAVHDTLVKIVERLSLMESDLTAPLSEKSQIADTPSMQFDPDLDLVSIENERPKNSSGPRSPAVAAVDAAMAAVQMDSPGTDISKPAKLSRKTSLLGGLAKVVRGRHTSLATEPSQATEHSELDASLDDVALLEQISDERIDEIDPKLANQPIEPGSGMPDLNTIMKRVRDERRDRNNADGTDAGKTDFIVAARRAAQAAAAESARLKSEGSAKKNAKTPQQKSAIIDLVSRQRKPILMAIGAIMIAMAGLQLGSAFLKSNDAQIEPSVKTADLTPDVDLSATVNAIKAPAIEVPVVEAVEATAEPTLETPNASLIEPLAPAPEISENTAADDTLQTVTEAAHEPAVTVSIPTIPHEAGPNALREAAAQGDARALYEIGNRYTEGRGVTADFAKAAQWYNLAAVHGFAPAEYRIGNFNEKGLGMPRDTAQAKTWYQLAAAQGNANAMHNLAVLFATGANDAPDNVAAARWFNKAAELGVKDSQFNLGILAAKGLGMPANLEESYKWFALAANDGDMGVGDTDAAEKRDEIAKALTPDQLVRAQATVELWKAKPLDQASNSIDVPDAWLEAETLATGSIDMKKAVRNIQLILQKNGYDAGSADGVMGTRTRNAIVAFQKANGQAPTGNVDQQLVQALLEKNK